MIGYSTRTRSACIHLSEILGNHRWQA